MSGNSIDPREQNVYSSYSCPSLECLINVLFFRELGILGNRFPRSRKIEGRRTSREKINFLELRISYKHRAVEHKTSSGAPVSSVWNRPQCNIGLGISPVTISTMDDSRKHPGSPGLASSPRRRRANDEMNAPRMLRAITAAVVVVAAVTSSVTHTMLASGFRRSINERRRASTGRSTAKTSTSAASTVLGVSTGCHSRS